MVSWIKSLWQKSPISPSNEVKSITLDSNPINFTPSPVIQTDVRQRRRMKRLRKSLDQQLVKAEIMGMKPHEAGCNIEMCFKPVCFEREPDKIVSAPYDIKR